MNCLVAGLAIYKNTRRIDERVLNLNSRFKTKKFKQLLLPQPQYNINTEQINV